MPENIYRGLDNVSLFIWKLWWSIIRPEASSFSYVPFFYRHICKWRILLRFFLFSLSGFCSFTMNCKMPFNFKVSNHPTALLLTFLLTTFPWFFVSQARFSPCCTFFQLGHQYIKLRNPSKSRCLQQHPTYHFFPSSEGSSVWTVWSGCWRCLYCCYMEAFFEYYHWKLPKAQ